MLKEGDGIMATLKDILQRCVDMEYTELVELAKRSLAAFLPKCREVDNEHDGMLLTASIVLAAVAADGELTPRENRFLCDVMALDQTRIEALVLLYDAEMEALADSFADHCEAAVKAEILTFCVCVAACDGTINREESAFLRRLLA